MSPSNHVHPEPQNVALLGKLGLCRYNQVDIEVMLELGGP